MKHSCSIQHAFVAKLVGDIRQNVPQCLVAAPSLETPMRIILSLPYAVDSDAYLAARNFSPFNILESAQIVLPRYRNEAGMHINTPPRA